MSERLPILDELDALRPRTWGDCLHDGWGDDGTPCPWVGCSHHLAWGARISDGLVTGEPGDERLLARVEALDIEAMPHTCALRVVDSEPTLEEVGQLFAITKERVRQIEAKGRAALARGERAETLRRHLDDGREIERPDLAPDDGWVGLSRGTRDGDALARAVARVVPGATQDRAEAQRRQGVEPEAIPARVYTGPPVRVLQGEERARRIAELRARDGRAPTPTTPRPEPQAQTTPATKEREIVSKSVDQEAGDAARRALAELAETLGVSKCAAMKIAGLSPSTASKLRDGKGASPRTVAALEAALVKAREGGAPAAATARPKAPARAAATVPATRAPSSSLSLDDLPRVLAVIAQLGGLERAERIAAAIGGES